jgi:hypothetical protein
MNTVEIIHLRSSGESLESLAERIRESLWEDGSISDKVEVYRRNGLDTDIAVHIHHRRSNGGNGPSTLAFNLANALRSFGIVEHAVWEEMK